MNILFIGDLVGSAGRKILKSRLPLLKDQYEIDLCIANAENAAAGLGLTAPLVREIRQMGVNLLTLGNHTWSKRELLRSIDELSGVIRPANVPQAWPGQSYEILRHAQGDVLVVNLLGRVFMDPVDDPFAAMDHLLDTVKKEHQLRMVIVDFHAEATSEKNAMAHYLDGRVSLVAGTHTHVQTADERILPCGTACITDVGMTGPTEGVIGMDAQSSIRRFVHHLPSAYAVAKGKSSLCAVFAKLDAASGKALHIERIRLDE